MKGSRKFDSKTFLLVVNAKAKAMTGFDVTLDCNGCTYGSPMPCLIGQQMDDPRFASARFCDVEQLRVSHRAYFPPVLTEVPTYLLLSLQKTHDVVRPPKGSVSRTARSSCRPSCESAPLYVGLWHATRQHRVVRHGREGLFPHFPARCHKPLILW